MSYFFLNPSNYYLLTVKKCHGDSVKNESARARKAGGGGGAPDDIRLVLRNFVSEVLQG